MKLYGREWTRRAVEARVGRIEQVGDYDVSNVPKGQSLVPNRFRYALVLDYHIPYYLHVGWILGWLNSAASRSVGFPPMVRCTQLITMIIALPLASHGCRAAILMTCGLT